MFMILVIFSACVSLSLSGLDFITGPVCLLVELLVFSVSDVSQWFGL